MTEKTAQPLTTTPPSKAELASRLRALASHMLELSVQLDCFGDYSESMQHSNFLRGASCVVAGWPDSFVDDSDIPERP